MQERPFSSVEEEALLNLMRTSDFLHRAFHCKTRDWGVTSTQYNVLRILRGAQPRGLTCAAIGSRMITAEPDITRLLARLKALETHPPAARPPRPPRRVDANLRGRTGTLARDGSRHRAGPARVARALDQTELTELIRLLELARKNSEAPPFDNADENNN